MQKLIPHASRQRFDLIVLGAGLAGLRAALSALEADPSLTVGVVSPSAGPSGSSFANFHDQLGMQVLLGELEQESFVREVCELAAPGEVDPALVRIMAAESSARYEDMRRLGVGFVGEDGEAERYPGCFSQDRKRAVLFRGLGEVRSRFVTRLEALGARFLRALVMDLVRDDTGRVRGVLCNPVNDPAGTMAYEARTVILALGGPAPIFARQQAGPHNPGYAMGMMARAGVETINEHFMQVMWSQLPERRFWSPARLAEQGLRLRTEQGTIAVPERLSGLARERRQHCPASYGRPDAALDAFLARHVGEEGYAEIYSSGEGWQRISPMAHAGNGGARIDANGRTSLAGLWAVGECASGMHGANRIGGAMVLATQVFGHRAGRDAVSTLMKNGNVSDKSFTQELNDHCEPRLADEAERIAVRAWMSWELQRCLLVENPAKPREALARIEERRGRCMDWQSRMLLDTARSILSRQTSILSQGERLTTENVAT
jgi:L-aspartate oxidase